MLENLLSLWGSDQWKLLRGGEFDQKICPGNWDLTVFENYPQGGMLGTD